MPRTPKPPAPPKPITSGFCNPTLPRTDDYDPHTLCTMARCVCTCHQETPMPEPTPEVDRLHADGLPRRLAACVLRNPNGDETHRDCCRFPKTCSPFPYDETPVTDADLEPRRPESVTTAARGGRELDGDIIETPEQAVAFLSRAAGCVNVALHGYDAPAADAIRLLRSLRDVTEVLAKLDAALVQHIYLHGEHGLHQSIDGIKGGVNITRSRTGESWEHEAIVEAVIDAHMTARSGQVPDDPHDVVKWITDAAGFSYWRKGVLKDLLGVHPKDADLLHDRPGKPQVTFDR